jgi:hypothetical protein
MEDSRAALGQLAGTLALVDARLADQLAAIGDAVRALALRQDRTAVRDPLALRQNDAAIGDPLALRRTPLGKDLATLRGAAGFDPRQPALGDHFALIGAARLLCPALRRLAHFVAGMDLGTPLLAGGVGAARSVLALDDPALLANLTLFLALGPGLAAIAAIAAVGQCGSRHGRGEQQGDDGLLHLTHSMFRSCE